MNRTLSHTWSCLLERRMDSSCWQPVAKFFLKRLKKVLVRSAVQLINLCTSCSLPKFSKTLSHIGASATDSKVFFAKSWFTMAGRWEQPQRCDRPRRRLKGTSTGSVLKCVVSRLAYMRLYNYLHVLVNRRKVNLMSLISHDELSNTVCTTDLKSNIHSIYS